MTVCWMLDLGWVGCRAVLNIASVLENHHIVHHTLFVHHTLKVICIYKVNKEQGQGTMNKVREPHSGTVPERTYSFGKLRVHHEVVDVLLGAGQLQFPGHHGHQQGSTSGPLSTQSWDIFTRIDKAQLTRLVSCVSIMKLWTCFSARVSSSFLDTTATRRAVQPAPWAHTEFTLLATRHHRHRHRPPATNHQPPATNHQPPA